MSNIVLAKPKQKYWISYILQRIKKNKNFLGFVSGQTGCLEENTLIKTLVDGKIVYKKIKDMDEDIIVSYNFENRKFEYNKAHLIEKGMQDVFKITFSDGSSVLATKDHKFFLPSGEEIDIEKLMKKDKRYRLASKNYPLINENNFYGKEMKRISKIEYVGKRKVYDLNVEGTPNYILKNGLVSHNSGKSWSCLAMCEQLDPNFNINNCVFSGIELMTLINSGKLKKGSCIIFEEVGVEMSNKNWQSTTNKMINYLVQTFRHRGFILLMNSPYMDFVDSGTRKLFHAEMQTLSINRTNKTVKLKPQLIQYNSRMKKFYYKRLKVILPEGVIPVDAWNVESPSSELAKVYEEKKLAYTNRLNQTIQTELEAIANKGKPKEKNPLTDVQQETLDLLKQGMNMRQIAISRNRTEGSVRSSIKWLKQKGYDFKPVYCHIRGKKLEKYDIIEPNAGKQEITETASNV